MNKFEKGQGIDGTLFSWDCTGGVLEGSALASSLNFPENGPLPKQMLVQLHERANPKLFDFVELNIEDDEQIATYRAHYLDTGDAWLFITNDYSCECSP